MKKVLLLTDKPFAQVAIDGIQKVVSEAGYELKLCEKYGTDLDRVKRVAADVDAMIIRSDKVGGEIMDAAPGLKIIVRAGAGYDNVDLEAATARNICVMNTPGQNSNAVAELAFGMMVMAVRNFYNGTSGSELMGKKLGIHAYGNVGRNVARIAKGFGMEIYAFDAYCPKELIEADGVIPVDSPEALYETCNVVSIHIPATPGTRMSINYNLLGRMPKNALIVNTARKEVINEIELVKVMEDRPDLTALLDVTFPEPPPAGSKLYTTPNILVSPHIAGSLNDEVRRMSDYMLAEYKRFAAGEEAVHEVLPGTLLTS